MVRILDGLPGSDRCGLEIEDALAAAEKLQIAGVSCSTSSLEPRWTSVRRDCGLDRFLGYQSL